MVQGQAIGESKLGSSKTRAVKAIVVAVSYTVCSAEGVESNLSLENRLVDTETVAEWQVVKHSSSVVEEQRPEGNIYLLPVQKDSFARTLLGTTGINQEEKYQNLFQTTTLNAAFKGIVPGSAV
jgi:hypothetical protein